MGVRPSFEAHSVVVEKLCRRDCHAGTRNPGRLGAEDAFMALPSTLPRLGANIVAIGSALRSPCRLSVSDLGDEDAVEALATF